MTNAEKLSMSKLHTEARSTLDGQILTTAKMRELLRNTGKNIGLQVDYAFAQGQPNIARGSRIHLLHSGQFECASCHKTVKKLFDAYCYPCFKSKAAADMCMMSPHLCHYLQGSCREPEWGASVCYQPHYLYMAHTDKYKIGITREGQVPTRWFDQGATSATVLARVGSRHQVGILEHFLTQILADKSNWQRMLKEGNSRPTADDFVLKRNEVLRHLISHDAYTSGNLLAKIPGEFSFSPEIEIFEHSPIFEITYPLPEQMPAKIVSVNLDKSPEIEGVVLGVKGQYLFLENSVFNVRRHEGYLVEMQNN